MLRKTLAGIGIGLFSLATALPIDAQEIATIALRNGERPSGELIDLNASGFILRVNGQIREIPVGEVASVEFVVGPLPADAQARINAGQPVVLLRSGQVLDGRLSDVGGTRPLRLTVDTPSGPRDFTSNDVAQLHLSPLNNAARVAGQPSPPAQTNQGGRNRGSQGGRDSNPANNPGSGAGGRNRRSPSGNATEAPADSIPVPANQGWTDTGVTVARGSRVQFAAYGNVMISPSASSGPGGSPAVTSPSARYPLQGAPAGALLGRIGTGTPFLIGTNTQSIQMPNTGRLMLGVNDDQLGDNSGNYSVVVTRTSR